MKTRIQKLIAESGYCSRRHAEDYIAAGAVKVNGKVVTVGDKAEQSDVITVNGERIAKAPTVKRYIKLYKPRGYVTALSDPNGQAKKLITELIKDVPERVFPVGRLDKNSEGLLLLTNDGEFENNITHPSRKVKKTYRVTVPSDVPDSLIDKLSAGVDIGGDITAPCEVTKLSAESGRSVLRFVITEGKNRQIRRMCEAVGLEVSRLKRTSVGGVKLGMLQPGKYVDLTKEELRLLGVFTAGNKKTRR
jgi:23S rRNA pseudouridine2605 synthase